MEGYIQNKSSMWRHALKRSIAPGEKIPLDDLYEQYGIKHDIANDKSFVDWLRQVKLRNEEIWEIRYRGDEPDAGEKKRCPADEFAQGQRIGGLVRFSGQSCRH